MLQKEPNLRPPLAQIRAVLGGERENATSVTQAHQRTRTLFGQAPPKAAPDSSPDDVAKVTASSEERVDETALESPDFTSMLTISSGDTIGAGSAPEETVTDVEQVIQRGAGTVADPGQLALPAGVPEPVEENPTAPVPVSPAPFEDHAFQRLSTAGFYDVSTEMQQAQARERREREAAQMRQLLVLAKARIEEHAARFLPSAIEAVEPISRPASPPTTAPQNRRSLWVGLLLGAIAVGVVIVLVIAL
jgi:hypothetical protein